MRSNRLALITATSLIGVALAILLAEVTLRVAGMTSKLVYQPNPYFGWAHTAGDSFLWTTEDRQIKIDINELGLRDHEYPYGKPPGVTRILVLGDSFAEALQVPLEDSFSKILERALNGDSNPRRFEAINAGVSGYGTDNALLFFQHEGFKYQPDIVLLAFYVGNDVRNNSNALEVRAAGGARKPYYELGPQGLSLRRYPFAEHTAWTTRGKVFLNRHSRLYAFVRELREQGLQLPGNGDNGEPERGDAAQTGARLPLDMELFLQQPPTEWLEAWQLTQGLLRELRDSVATHGGRLVVVLVPTAFQVHDQIWNERLNGSEILRTMSWALHEPNAQLMRICREEQLLCLDLLPPFRAKAAGSDALLYFPHDNHWNESGHREAADVIFQALREWSASTGL